MGETPPSIWNTAPQWVIFAAFVLFAARWLWSWWAERRHGHQGATSSAVTDAATANTTLRAESDELRRMLRDEREDNRAKDARIDVLEARCEELRQQIIDQRNEYEKQLRDMQAKVSEVSAQLDTLRRQLEALPKP